MCAYCTFCVTSVVTNYCFTHHHQVACETNEELRRMEADPAEGFDVGAILSIARRYRF